MNFKIKSRVWIELDGNVLLGEGRARLLDAIDTTGSLSKAAKQQGISYKKAWEMVRAINQSSPTAVVIKSAGGVGGGGTVLTVYGEDLLKTYKEINQSCWDHLDNEVTKLNSL